MLNRESGVPIYIQIQEQLEEMLQEGVLKANDLVPSENELAEKLKVSRLTVRKSYVEMVKRGYFYTIQGKGTYVKEDYPMIAQPKGNSGNKKVIGVILPDIQGFFTEIFSAVKQICEEAGLSVLLMFNDEVKNEITAIKQVLESSVQGIIIVPSRNANTIVEHYQKLMNSGIPTVMIGKPPFKIAAPSVYCDDVFAVYRSVELLLEHENTRIAYVTNSLNKDEASYERYEGYAIAVRDYLPGADPVVLDMNSPDFEKELKSKILGEDPLTAFFCVCDAAAAEVYRCLQNLGKKIPEEIELIGYDNVNPPDNYGIDKKVSTVDQRRSLMGGEAVRLLQDIMEHGETKHTHMQIVVHPKLVLRETTRGE